MNRILICFLLAVITVSCYRPHPMEVRAKKQIAVSLEDHLESHYPGMSDWRMEGLKTVYVNDSLCILQCSAYFRDSSHNDVIRDYRYIYMLDMDLSRAYRRAFFTERFLNTLCLTDDEIKQGRQVILDTRENVYNSFQGACLPIQRPFQEE